MIATFSSHGRKSNMRKNLTPGTIIIFGTENRKSFKITSLLSEDGMSCLVYLATYKDFTEQEHKVILKEFYPKGLGIKRDGYSLVVPEESKDKFEFYKLRFKEGYNKQVTFRKIDKAINKSSDAREMYEGYNTLFIEMQCDYGYCYNQVENESLQDILKTAKALAEAIKVYHDNELLHLDIKPANIFLLNETKELVKLFDYDSVCSKHDIALGKAILSFSERWAAPELLMLKDVSEATDIYSIGAVVFSRIFGYTPTSKHRKFDSRYDFTNNKIFENVSPAIYEPLIQFFRKTLQATPKARYNDVELINALDTLIFLSMPKNIYLANHTFSSSEQFIGRATELQAIQEKLYTYKFCIVHGMGGIGKTEIVKQYANINRSYYHTIYAIKYSGDLKNDIINMDFINLNNNDFIDENGVVDTEKLFKFKKDKIQELDENTLIIVDNFNTDNDPYINDIISHHNKHHTLFTTKNEVFGKSQLYVEVNELTPEFSLELFYTFYRNHSEENIIINIIEFVQRNTLAIKLIATTMQIVAISPQEMLAKLQSGITNEIAVKIKISKDILGHIVDDETLFNHLCTVFDIAKLSPEQKYILMNMTYVSQHEISDKAFLNILEIDYENNFINAFYALLEQNWIYKDNESNIISLHPIVAAVVMTKLQPGVYSCSKMVINVAKLLSDNNYEILNVKQKILLGEEILKLNKIPVHLLCEIFYGLSVQYGTPGAMNNMKKALDFGLKAKENYCHFRTAKKSICQFNAAIQKQESISQEINTPLNKAIFKIHYVLSLIIGKEPDTNKNEKLYDEYLALSSDFFSYKALNELILKNIALLYFQTQQYKEALRHFKKINKSMDTLFISGQCKFYIGDYDNAIIVFEKALLEYGYDNVHHKSIGEKIGFNISKFMDYITQYLFDSEEEVIEPKTISVIYIAKCFEWIAYCYNKKSEINKSINCVKLLEAFTKDNGSVNYETNMLIANIYEINSKYDQANIFVSAAKMQCETLEQELNAVVSLADNKMTVGNFAEALTNWEYAHQIALKKYDEKHEMNIKIATNIGDCHFKNGNYLVAQKCYEDLLQILNDTDYNKIIISQKLAKTFYELKQTSYCEKWYNEAISAAISLLGENTDILSDLYYEIAQLYSEIDKKKSIEYFEKCLNIRKSLYHIEHEAVIKCQQQLIHMYQLNNDPDSTKLMKKHIRKVNSKINFTMLFSFLIIMLSSILSFTFECRNGYFFNPSINPLNTVVQSAIFFISILAFFVTLILNISKFTKSLGVALIALSIMLGVIIAQCNISDLLDISISILHESNYTNENAQRTLDIIFGFGLDNLIALLPLILFTWFLTYNSLFDHKISRFVLCLILTTMYMFLFEGIVLLSIFITFFIFRLRKNTYGKWIFPNKAEKAFLSYIFIAFLFIFFIYLKATVPQSIEYALANDQYSILVLPALNLFSPVSESLPLIIQNYPIINMMAQFGIFAGAFYTIVYFGFVIAAMINSKRIKSGYLKTIYETICFYFLLMGVLSIINSFIFIFFQYLSIKNMLSSVLFPFLSFNPLFLISNFFFAGILFNIYYNRAKLPD